MPTSCMMIWSLADQFLHFVNSFPFSWYSKKQATVETATYGSEFNAARTCTEQLIDHRNTLRYLGVPLRKSYMLGDNESVVGSSRVPSAKLHKCHSMLSFHRVRESNQPSWYPEQTLGLQQGMAHLGACPILVWWPSGSNLNNTLVHWLLSLSGGPLFVKPRDAPLSVLACTPRWGVTNSTQEWRWNILACLNWF